jgi:hypothetical protein
MSDTNPAVVTDALLATPLRIGDIQLQPLTLGLYLLLEKMGSPIVRAGAQDVSPLALFQAVYVLAHPLPESLAAWAQGPDLFDAAVLGFADRIPLSELDKLGDKIIQHVKAAFATAAKTEPPDGGNSVPLAGSPTPAAG